MEKSNSDRVPKLRFPGFTDDWEQRKLLEMSDSFEYGLNAAAKDFDGVHKYIRITDIDDSSHNFLQNGLTSPNTDLNNADNYKLQEGDILFARTGASVGKTYIYKECDGLVYYAGFLIRARINSEYDPQFIFQSTLSDTYNYFIKITSQRSGQPGVNAQEYGNFTISVPTKDEQTQIGTFFKELDNLITLHQRKLDNLKNKKKCLLQKMLPKNGESFPKLRFPGFTDDWEQCELGEIGDIITGSTPSTKHEEYYSSDGIPWITPTDIKTNLISNSQRKLSEAGARIARIVPANTILVTCIASIGKNALLQVNGGFNQQINGLTPSKKYDSYFLLTESEHWSDQMKKNAAAATMQIVNKKDFSNIETMVPLKDEQFKIGLFFKQLDNLITLHQRKLDHLKERKKALLSQMFI